MTHQIILHVRSQQSSLHRYQNCSLRKASLSAKELFEELKTRGISVSYQYVHKSLIYLEKHMLVVKSKSKYSLNSDYLLSLKEFLTKSSNEYSLDQNVFFQSITGSLLRVFSKDEAETIAKELVQNINRKIMKKLDEWYSYYYDPEGKELAAILSQADFKNKVVLELGSGTGRLSSQLASKCKAIIAVDHNKDVIEYCKEKFKNTKNVTFINQSLTDLKNLPYKNFDIVLSGWTGIHYAKNLKQIIEKFHSLLKNNGKLIILESFPESEYVEILNILQPKEDDITYKQNLLTKELFNQFKTVDKKIVSLHYVFPNYEKLEETFKIELEYEEGLYWRESDSVALKKYFEGKKKFEVGESFLLITCTKSTD